MATFVSLATCHHCPVTSSRRGLIYRDSLSALSSNLRAPRGPYQSPGPCPCCRHHCRLHRTELPESFALAGPKPPGSMKHLLLTHLRRLLTASPPQRQRSLRLAG